MDQTKKDSEQVLLQQKNIASRSTPHAFTASKKEDDDDDVLKKKGRPSKSKTTELSSLLKKCVSSFEMARFLALLTSIPPLEREGGKEGKDGRAAIFSVSSFLSLLYSKPSSTTALLSFPFTDIMRSENILLRTHIRIY